MDLHDLTAAYALDALDRDERIRFERHLGQCERCRAELSRLAGAAAALAFAAPAARPPERLRRRIIAAAAPEEDTVVPLQPRRLFLRRASGIAASVAACTAIGLGVWGVTLSHELSSEQTRNAAMEIVLDPSSYKAGLHGRRGMVAVDARGRGVLLVHRLPEAPSGKTYETWVIPRGGTAQRAAVFAGGGGMTMVMLEQSVPRGAVVATTIEPAGGVSVPTARPLFSAQT